jgi:hypothetical protein
VIIIIQLLDSAIKLYKALRPGMPLPWENWRLEHDIEEMASRAEQFGEAMEARAKKPRGS